MYKIMLPGENYLRRRRKKNHADVTISRDSEALNVDIQYSDNESMSFKIPCGPIGEMKCLLDLFPKEYSELRLVIRNLVEIDLELLKSSRNVDFLKDEIYHKRLVDYTVCAWIVIWSFSNRNLYVNDFDRMKGGLLLWLSRHYPADFFEEGQYLDHWNRLVGIPYFHIPYRINAREALTKIDVETYHLLY